MFSHAPRIEWTRAAIKVAALLITCCLPGCTQTANAQFSISLPDARHAPLTLTFKDALGLAEKNDPTVSAAATDAASAHEDYRQTRESLLPSLSGRSEYLGTQGNGKLPTGRFVTNDGVHVYREWAVVHQDLSSGTFSRSGLQKSSAAEALSRAKLEIARRGLAATVTKNYYS